MLKDFAFGQWVQSANVDCGNAQFIWNLGNFFKLPLSLIVCDIPTTNKECNHSRYTAKAFIFYFTQNTESVTTKKIVLLDDLECTELINKMGILYMHPDSGRT